MNMGAAGKRREDEKMQTEEELHKTDYQSQMEREHKQFEEDK